MGERWVALYVNDDETLRCFFCSKDLHGQRVHLYLDVNDELDEVMCETCFKKDQMEIEE